MNYSEEKKRGNGLLITIIVILLLIIAFFGGFFVKGMMKDEKTNKNEEKEENEKVEKSNVPVTDTYAFARRYLMFINNGDLYFYDTRNERLSDLHDYVVDNVTHSGCYYDNTGEYCAMNPEYSKRATKIDGVKNVKRIKLYNTPSAIDESFSFFAITEDGNVYSINDYEKTEAKLFLGNGDVEDMLGGSPESIEILLKNGKHMIYSWKFKDGPNFEWETTYEEKK